MCAPNKLGRMKFCGTGNRFVGTSSISDDTYRMEKIVSIHNLHKANDSWWSSYNHCTNGFSSFLEWRDEKSSWMLQSMKWLNKPQTRTMLKVCSKDRSHEKTAWTSLNFSHRHTTTHVLFAYSSNLYNVMRLDIFELQCDTVCLTERAVVIAVQLEKQINNRDKPSHYSVLPYLLTLTSNLPIATHMQTKRMFPIIFLYYCFISVFESWFCSIKNSMNKMLGKQTAVVMFYGVFGCTYFLTRDAPVPS